MSALRSGLWCAAALAAVGCSPALATGAPTPTAASCPGDCDGNGTVTVDELLTMARVALGDTSAAACTAGDADRDARISVEEIGAAVNGALRGCASAPVALSAAAHFDQLLEPINELLLGSVQVSPLADTNALLRALVSPPYIRLDAGFEDSGCPDNPDAGPLYDATSNTFNYCRLDERIANALSAGATPLLIVDYTPLALAEANCAASNGHGLGVQHCPPADYQKYSALVNALVRHVFSAYAVTDFEVWNEPDGLFFAGRLPDYLKLYDTCNAAIVDAEQALGLAPGSLHVGGPATLAPDQAWIDGLLNHAVMDPALRVDFISWHTYANNFFVHPPDPLLHPGTYADGTAQVRTWIAPFLAQRPDLHPALWIDEWNVNAGYDGRMDTAYDAAFMVASMHAMQDAGLDRAARFNTWDATPASPIGFNGNWGLFTNDGQVRPALYAFALWRQMAPTRVAVELLDAASQTRNASTLTRYDQNLIASVDSAARQATILLYNFVPANRLDAAPPYCGGGPALDASLQFDGLADGTYTLEQQRVDCTVPIRPVAAALLDTVRTTVVAAGRRADVSIHTPADSVVFLRLIPMS